MMFQKHFIRLNQCNKLISASNQLRPCSSKPKPKLPKRGGPTFKDFLAGANLDARPKIRRTPEDAHPYVTEEMIRGDGQKVYLDVYGCQMNVNDTEVVWSVLESRGYERTLNPKEADVWLLVTCSIREGAENKIWNKLKFIRDNSKVKSFNYKPSLKIGLLGCMAERLKDQMLQTNLVDLVAGPDSYRDLPRLLAVTKYADDSAINVILSLDETYADVIPSRLDKKSVTGFVSIQRGCDNMCSYCIVPFTRGRERSRPVQTILNEVKILVEAGVKEVTLLGQNVNSYLDKSKESMAIFGTELATTTSLAKGFKTIYKPKLGGLRFSDLLQKVSEIDPEVRIRFTSPHPKDFPDEVLHLISSTPNICNQLHLPAQCGSSRILEEMRRGYTRESYLELVDHVRSIIPDVRLSGDMIGGFCGETDEEFEETLSLIEKVKYGNLFCFQYSLREKTHAHRKLVDNVPLEVKQNRMERMHQLSRKISSELNKKLEGTNQLVLIEGDSKRSSEEFKGRTDGHVKTIFAKQGNLKPGDYALVHITESTSETLRGHVISQSSIQDFNKVAKH